MNEDQLMLCQARDALLPGCWSVEKPWEADIMVDFSNKRLVVVTYNLNTRTENKEYIHLDSIKDGSFKTFPMLKAITQ